ncbi:MAG: hypothetical protein QXS61_03670 [Candidatus Korarchaeum sp.]
MQNKMGSEKTMKNLYSLPSTEHYRLRQFSSIFKSPGRIKIPQGTEEYGSCGGSTSLRFLRGAHHSQGFSILKFSSPVDVHEHYPNDVGRVSARNVLRATVEGLEYRPPIYVVSFRVGSVTLRSSVTSGGFRDLREGGSC